MYLIQCSFALTSLVILGTHNRHVRSSIISFPLIKFLPPCHPLMGIKYPPLGPCLLLGLPLSLGERREKKS
ncbi:hypothetical protein ACSS6W_008623 [Trichoderma asperelloides]